MAWWEIFLIMALLLPIVLLWFGCIIDMVSRPDLVAWKKAGWVLLVLFFPLFGALAYIILRPKQVMAPEAGVDSAFGSGAANFGTTQSNPDPSDIRFI